MLERVRWSPLTMPFSLILIRAADHAAAHNASQQTVDAATKNAARQPYCFVDHRRRRSPSRIPPESRKRKSP